MASGLAASATRPYSSPLMKLATRPKKRPMGLTMATPSTSSAMESLCFQAYQMAVRMTQRMPPWEAMPPSQTRNTQVGSARKPLIPCSGSQ